MIMEVEGDLLQSRAEAIAHGVAPNDHFEQGLALALRERWPAMAKDFRHWCHTHNPKPGAVWGWAGSNGVRIYNLLTQEPPLSAREHGGRARLEYVNAALRALRLTLEKEKIRSLAMPRLATGVGRLSWPQIEPLIRQHLGGLAIPIFLYTTYRPGVTANELELAGPAMAQHLREHV